MAEKIKIPSPAELGKRLREDETSNKDKLEQLSQALLENSKIAEFLMNNRHILYAQKGSVVKEIEISPSELKEKEIDIVSLADHIKKALNNYTVIVKPNEKHNIITLVISIPLDFFINEEK